MKTVPSERQVQRAILQMAGLCFPDVLIVHVPNGSHLSGDDRARAMQMGALKGDGLKVGFPDLACYWNHGHCLIEVKRPGGKVSPGQEAMHADLAGKGYRPAVVTSPAEAHAFLVDRGAPCRVKNWREAA
jgi:hypothetical protein